MKKFLTVLISLLMILSVVPTAVFAEESEGEEKRDWEIYKNYVCHKDYKYGEGPSYVIRVAFVYLTEDFWENHSEIDASYFPEIADKIEKVECYEKSTVCFVDFKLKDYENLAEKDIDDFIASLEYILTLPYVVEVHPGITAFHNDPVDSDTTETEPVTEAPKPDTTEPVTTETTASETTSAEKTEENKLKNHQTGDNLIFAVSIAFVACAALTAAVAVKGKKRSENK